MFPLLRALFVALNIITLLLQFAFSWRSTPPWAVNKKIATLEDNSCLQRQTIYTVIKLSLSQGLTPDTKTDTITVFNQVELSEMNDNSERGRKKTLILTIPLLAMCIWSCIYSSLVHLWGSPTGLSTYKKRREEVWWDVSVMIKIEGLHILYSAGMTRGPERKIEQTDIFFSKGHIPVLLKCSNLEKKGSHCPKDACLTRLKIPNYQIIIMLLTQFKNRLAACKVSA